MVFYFWEKLFSDNAIKEADISSHGEKNLGIFQAENVKPKKKFNWQVNVIVFRSSLSYLILPHVTTLYFKELTEGAI